MNTHPGEIAAPEVQTTDSLRGWHKLGLFLRCPKAYQYKVLNGIVPEQDIAPTALAVGTLTHAGREYYLRKKNPNPHKLTDHMLHVADLQKIPVSMEARRQGLRYVHEYIEHYERYDLKPKTIATEYALTGSITEKYGDLGERTARLDDVSRYKEAGGGLCVGEFKTTSGSVAECYKFYQFHGQPILQLLLWAASENGYQTHGGVEGVCLDVMQKGSGAKKSQFARYILTFPDSVLIAMHRHLQHHIKRMAAIHAGKRAHRDPTGCSFTTGNGRVSSCEYKALCTLGDSVSRMYLKEGKPLSRQEARALEK